MDKIVARVAKALWLYHRRRYAVFGGPNRNLNWDELPIEYKQGIYGLAHAAIEALDKEVKG